MREGWTWVHNHFSQLPSTQTHPLAHPLQERQLVLISADLQTQGRGRGDRQWVSHASNFQGTFHLLLPAHRTPVRGNLSLLVAAALASSLATDLPSKSRLRLKWPNDVLINEKKVAGILLSAQGRHVRIGLGLNVQTAPDLGAAERPATALNKEVEGGWTESRMRQWRDRFIDSLLAFIDDTDDSHWKNLWKQWGQFGHPAQISGGRWVTPLDILEDGALLVDSVAGLESLYCEDIVS